MFGVERFDRPRRAPRLLVILLALTSLPVAGLCLLLGGRPQPAEPPAEGPPSLAEPLRPEPASFKPNSSVPRRPEGATCGSIDPDSFSAGRDLVYVDDPRAWWESDSDVGDDECDHSVHRAAKRPLLRLIELVSREGATLKVQDAYRPSGIHNSGSLHKEGRAVDVTCDYMPLEKLAKLCWAAGFDWVLYESDPRKGPHVHCSVKRDRAE